MNFLIAPGFKEVYQVVVQVNPDVASRYTNRMTERRHMEGIQSLFGQTYTGIDSARPEHIFAQPLDQVAARFERTLDQITDNDYPLDITYDGHRF